MITKLDRKKGKQGILSRTKVPKFEIETPTENAKNKENTNENMSKGWAVITTKNLKTFNLKSK